MQQKQTSTGIISRLSPHSVDETVARLRAVLEQRGIMLFAIIDHSGEAAKVGLVMPETKLLILGNPKAGTPLMLAAPSSAIDLPLKLLVSRDPDGSTRISCNDPHFLQDRHHLPAGSVQVLGTVAILADQVAQ